MKNHITKRNYFRKELIMGFLIMIPFNIFAWVGMPTPKLHVDGRYLKDGHDNIVNLHGVAITPSPWFNGQGSRWTNYNITGCLTYNLSLIHISEPTRRTPISYAVFCLK